MKTIEQLIREKAHGKMLVSITSKMRNKHGYIVTLPTGRHWFRRRSEAIAFTYASVRCLSNIVIIITPNKGPRNETTHNPVQGLPVLANR